METKAIKSDLIKAQMVKYTSYEAWAKRMVKSGDTNAYRYLWEEVHQKPVEQLISNEASVGDEAEESEVELTESEGEEPEQEVHQAKEHQFNNFQIRNKKNR